MAHSFSKYMDLKDGHGIQIRSLLLLTTLVATTMMILTYTSLVLLYPVKSLEMLVERVVRLRMVDQLVSMLNCCLLMEIQLLMFSLRQMRTTYLRILLQENTVSVHPIQSFKSKFAVQQRWNLDLQMAWWMTYSLSLVTISRDLLLLREIQSLVFIYICIQMMLPP